MPTDPNRKIEEMLEASARMRREQFGGDARMPGPMRAQLHDEIARRSRPREPERSWFSAWWPRLAIGAVATLILIGGPIWLGQRSINNIRQNAVVLDKSLRSPVQITIGGDLSSTEHATKPSASDQLQAVISSSGTQAVESGPLLAAPLQAAISNSAEFRAGTSSGTLAFSDAGKSALAPQNQVVAMARAEPPTSTTQPPAESLDEKLIADSSLRLAGGGEGSAESKKERSLIAAEEINRATAPTAGMAARGSGGAGAFGSGSRSGAQAQRQSFQAKNGTKQSAQVLRSFQVEQKSNEIRVIDSDGSIYKGAIVLAGAKAATRSPARKREADEVPAAASSYSSALDKAGKPREAEFSFRATGSNISLKKRVVVEGSYIVSGSVQARGRANATLEKAKQPAQQQSARIIGVLKINGETPVGIEAVSVEP